MKGQWSEPENAGRAGLCVTFQIGGNDRELDAIDVCVSALSGLDANQQKRAADYLSARFASPGLMLTRAISVGGIVAGKAP